jgi:deoxyribodipyrimidine photolyase-related protein
MAKLIYILGDQLSKNLSSLKQYEKGDKILMAEVMEEGEYVPHHKKKLVFVFSAMRHFAESLSQDGYDIDYVRLTDDGNSGSLTGELKRYLENFNADKVVITHSGEYRVQKMIESWRDDLGVEIDILDDDRFIADLDGLKKYLKDSKQILMENFYRKMRKKTGLLMNSDNKPVGDKWNYDKENRKAMPDSVDVPPQPSFEIDDITAEVIEMVEENFSDNFGDCEGFNYAVTKEEAEQAFDDFLENRLELFGKYQDAMREDLPFGFHSVISAYINIGLLEPLECCQKVEDYYKKDKCNLSSAEGFIRQIIGWREFVRGIYWAFMPDYKDKNTLNARRKIPAFYWDENKTEMNCLHHSIKHTRENAYSHHIQRLMVTGNFALLAGVKPDDINEWYMSVYADAYEWVELPNTHGMAIYADGGILGSKPYCSSGKYINRMSNFCKSCKYDVNKTTGEDACPFNFLYWNFLDKNHDKLKDNRRMGLVYSNYQKKSDEELEDIRDQSKNFLDNLEKY